MNKLFIRWLVAAALSGSSMPVWASGAGTTGAELLKIGVGARAVAMGEAYVAQADDVSSLYWNPGGLALMQQRQASFMYNQWLRDLTFQNAGIGIPLENGAIGASLSYLSYGDIAGYDTAGQSIGNQSANSAVATLGASWLGNQWSLGFNAKGVQEKLADEKATTAAFDIGGTVIYPRPVLGGTIRLGASMLNLGSGLKFIDEKAPLPRNLKAGIAAVQMLDRKLNLSLDYTKPRDEDGYVSTGAEYWIAQIVALRAGWLGRDEESSGIRGGVGLRYKAVSFDYALASFNDDLGMTHRYELSFRFGEPRPVLTAEQMRIYRQAKAAMRQQRYEQAVLLFDSLIEMEPRFKKAQRLIKVSMASLEVQQKEMLARQGKQYDPATAKTQRKPNLAELDDLEQLLNLGTPKAAQTPAGKTEGR